jgi:hypothetical protein
MAGTTDAAVRPAPKGALRRESVRKNVAAIHVSGKLSLLQRKLSNVLLLNAYDDLLTHRSHRIDARTLCVMIGYNSNDMDTLKDALRALVETTAEWDMLGDDGAREWGVSALLASARLRHGTCEYAYSPALAEKLHDPKIFALINLSIQRNFTSGHALALYENCYRFVRTGSTGWWDLDLFRRLMGVEGSDYYANFKHLNAKVVKPAVAEVNRVANIELTPEVARRGRAVAQIRFRIAGNGQGGPFDADEEAGAAPSDVQARLTALGVADRLARQWIAEHGEAYVTEKLDYVAGETHRGRVRGSPVGYLSAAIRDDYRAGRGGESPAPAPRPKARAPRPGAEAKAAVAALRKTWRAACFDAVEALAAARNATQRDADRRQFLGRIRDEVDREDFRARGWRSAVNAAAIFAFWNEVAPGALPSIGEIAAARGHDWAALSAEAEAGEGGAA